MRDLSQLNLCVVGANGRMGRLFSGLWQGKVGRVYELDLRPGSLMLAEDDIAAGVPQADVVIMSVPIDKLEAALQSVAPHLAPKCLLGDVSSVKTLPMQLMEKYHQGPVVGAHPLFGPESASETGAGVSDPVTGTENRFLQQEFKGSELQVALVPGRGEPEALALMAELFRLAGCASFATSAEEHDRAIATIQSLNFLSNLAYFATAADLPDLEKYITPSFRRRLFASRTMLQEDAELFINIARHTPQLREALQAYTRTLEEAVNLNGKALGDLLGLARRYFADN